MDHRQWIAYVTNRRGTAPLGRGIGTEMDAWEYRLNDANDTRFYRTESARDAQSSFLWQGKICQVCPLWRH
jgi:hypothetical protein